MVMMTLSASPLIKIGISSCLLGFNVRYDGGNRKNSYITEHLSHMFELVPYCPEVAINMGIPRPPIQLVELDGEIRALGIDNPEMDMSIALRNYGKNVALQLTDVSGYIFKQNSPSCGVQKVKVLTRNQQIELRGQGLFAREIMQYRPDLPVIDEQQLSNEDIRQQFIQDVRKHHHARQAS